MGTPAHICRSSAFLATRQRLAAIVLLCSLALGGCQSLPDLTEFATSSTVLRSNVAEVGETVAADLQTAAEVLATKKSVATARASDAPIAFVQAWERRIAAMDEFVAFSFALKEVADAGNSGEESAKAVFSSVRRLASTVDGILPGSSGALESIESVVAAGYGEYAKYKAHKAIGVAVANAGPAIDKVVEFVNADLDSAAIAFSEAVLLRGDELRRNYESIRVPYTDMVAQRSIVLKEMGRALADTTNPDADGAIATFVARAEQIEGRIASLRPEWDEFQAKQFMVDDRLARGMALIGVTGSSLRDWHSCLWQVAGAMSEGSTPTAATLAQSAGRIRGFLDRWREL